MGQVIAVASTAVDRDGGKRRTGPKNLGGHGVQGPGQVGFGAGRVSGRVRHDVGEALGLAGGVMAGQGVLHGPQRGARRPRGGHEGEIHGGLRLRRGRSLREEIVIASRAVILALVIWWARRDRGEVTRKARDASGEDTGASSTGCASRSHPQPP